MGENVVFLVIFDACDVMYNWDISLLPPFVHDNLFGYLCFGVCLFVSLHVCSQLRNLLTDLPQILIVELPWLKFEKLKNLSEVECLVVPNLVLQ